MNSIVVQKVCVNIIHRDLVLLKINIILIGTVQGMATFNGICNDQED
jgi:hypothetical protein